MKMHTADRDVAQRTLPVSDAVRNRSHDPEGRGERQPADQRRLPGRRELLVIRLTKLVRRGYARGLGDAIHVASMVSASGDRSTVGALIATVASWARSHPRASQRAICARLEVRTVLPAARHTRLPRPSQHVSRPRSSVHPPGCRDGGSCRCAARAPAAAASPGVNDGGVVANAVPAKFTPEHRRRRGRVDGPGGQPDGRRRLVHQVTPTAGAGAGTAVTRNYLFAFNATTGALDTGFVTRGRTARSTRSSRPPTAPASTSAAQFTTAGGVSTRLAEFNLTTGARVTTFNPSLNGPINDMALVGSRLFIAGTFTSVKSVVHDGLASVNADYRRARPVPVGQPDRPPQLRPGRRRRRAPGWAPRTSPSRRTARG